MSGALSEHRTGFPAALQHDLFLKPSECGGPLADLDGQIVGINIAHSGRIESLAIPGPTVALLLKSIDKGRFFHPELDDLQKAKTNLEGEVQRLAEMESRIRKQLEDVAKKLDSLTAK
jgi:serine protease Do